MMIETKQQLKQVLDYEKKIYTELGYKGKLHSLISSCEVGYIYKYVEALRNDEYYTNCKRKLSKIKRAYWRRRHNRLGVKLGIFIPVNTFEQGLRIYHSQSIIVHKDAKVGKDCSLHGMNCIGNNGKEDSERNTPIIGDHCDIGVGASVIGGVVLGNNIKVAAGAVVCKNCRDNGAILIGVPARGKNKC